MKSLYIRTEDLDRWGYTASCPRCRKMWQGFPSKGVAHSAACRTRIEMAMSNTNDPRWNAATNRLAQRMVELYPEPAAAAQPGESSSVARIFAPVEEARAAPAGPPQWLSDAGWLPEAGFKLTASAVATDVAGSRVGGDGDVMDFFGSSGEEEDDQMLGADGRAY